jgi:ATP-dependent Clp protease protease subunit
MYEIMAEHTGQAMEKVHKDCDRNLWLEAEEAIAYGVVDRTLKQIGEPIKTSGSDMAPPGGETESADQ